MTPSANPHDRLLAAFAMPIAAAQHRSALAPLRGSAYLLPTPVTATDGPLHTAFGAALLTISASCVQWSAIAGWYESPTSP